VCGHYVEKKEVKYPDGIPSIKVEFGVEDDE